MPGGKWSPVWNGLFRRFVDVDGRCPQGTPWMITTVKTREPQQPEVRKAHREATEAFLRKFRGE